MMKAIKINSKYCTSDKVQLMLSNAPCQIICSKDGYIYLRDGDETIHRYLDDPAREEMPYKDNPSSARHASHLFEFDKLYAKFTSDKAMRTCYYDVMYCIFDFNFLYFVKAENGEAILVELDLEDFQAEENEEFFTSSELEDFLYSIENGKCIFNCFRGIQYAKFRKEDFLIDKKSIDLSDDGIVERYNLVSALHRPTRHMFDITNRIEDCDVHSIDEVNEFCLTDRFPVFEYPDRMPILLVFKADEIYVYEFDVFYIKKDLFKVKSKLRHISMSNIKYKDVIHSAKKSGYTSDPDFEE